MLYEVLQFIRGVWDAILLPYVIQSIANLATDFWEAAVHLRDTLFVLSCFICGCSHKSFPLSRSALETQRAALVAAAAASPATGAAAASSTSHRRRYYAGSEEENDADSEAEFPSTRRPAPEHELLKGGTAGGGGGDGGDGEGPTAAAPFIQRRLLLGRKGEVEEWLPAVRSRLLIPPHHPLCVSRSLHQLVSIVVGPIQQPTVSTMPTRHPDPQWPPHFLRTSSSESGKDSRSSAGGGAGDPSTDEYSSSNSSATPSTLRHRGSHTGAAGSSARYRQASSVVYKRVSSRQLDFSNSRVAPHVIASITAHHVLSYPATRQKVLVMDLDETLCYVSTTTANMAGPPTFSEVIPTASGAELFHVWERPYARLFLSTMAKFFNLVLFTSASKPYADTILQRIDPDHLLKLRYYRQDCMVVPRGMLKKMCVASGMRGMSSGSVGCKYSSDHSGAAAGLLGDLSTGTGGSHSGAGARRPTANTDGESTGAGAVDAGTRNAERSSATSTAAAAAATTTTRSPTAPGGTPTDVSAAGGSKAATTAAEELPVLEKVALNEHAKVLVKDLRVLKVPPELLVMIDNAEECTLVNPENALVVAPFIPSLTRGGAPSAAARPAREATAPRPEAQKGGRAAAASSLEGAQPNAEADSSDKRSLGSCAEVEPTTAADEALLMGDDIAVNEGPEEDEVLLALLPMLECLLVVPDVRSILRLGKLY